MGIFEWLFVGGLTALGGVTFLAEPTDVIIDEIFIAEEYSKLGFTEESVNSLLNARVLEIQAESGISPLDRHALRLNYKDSALAFLADEFGLMNAVNGLHALADMTDYRMSINVFSSNLTADADRDADTQLVAEIYLLETRSGRVVDSQKLTSAGDILPLVDSVAEHVLRMAKPTAHAFSLLSHEKPKDQHAFLSPNDSPAPKGTFKKARSFIESWIVRHESGSYEAVHGEWSSGHHARLQESMSDMFNMLGLSYMFEGNLDDAGNSFMKAIMLDDDHAAGYANMGGVLGLRGDYDSALTYLRKAVSLDKDQPLAYLYASAVLRKQGREEQALKVLDKLEAMPQGPGIGDLYRLRAAIYEDIGRSQEDIDTARRKVDIAIWKNPYQFGIFAR